MGGEGSERRRRRRRRRRRKRKRRKRVAGVSREEKHNLDMQEVHNEYAYTCK